MPHIFRKLTILVAFVALAALANTSQAQSVIGVPFPHTHPTPTPHPHPQPLIKKKMVYSVTVTVQNVKTGKFSQVRWDFTTSVWNGTTRTWRNVNFHADYNRALGNLLGTFPDCRFVRHHWHNYREAIGTW